MSINDKLPGTSSAVDRLTETRRAFLDAWLVYCRGRKWDLTDITAATRAMHEVMAQVAVNELIIMRGDAGTYPFESEYIIDGALLAFAP